MALNSDKTESEGTELMDFGGREHELTKIKSIVFIDLAQVFEQARLPAF